MIAIFDISIFIADAAFSDEYEVSIFLQETGSRHTILTKHKSFEGQNKISSNSNKLTGESGLPISVGDDGGEPGAEILVESDEEQPTTLQDIPEAAPADDESGRSKRRRRTRGTGDDGGPKSSDPAPPSKRKKTAEPLELSSEEEDEKKTGFATSYEGFSILGWMLCLLVRRKGEQAPKTPEDSGGQVLMEEWISTQAQPDDYEDE